LPQVFTIFHVQSIVGFAQRSCLDLDKSYLVTMSQ
jgi:hypothetical protein